MQLTERQEQVLKTIVDLYIATANPVGSQTVVTASGLAVSSATVRNEMAALEELGLIHQLHTSGGRVPTNEGYRYFVEHLMQPGGLAHTDAQTIRHQFQEAHTELQEWLKLAAAIMAHRLHTVGLITAPRSAEVRLRHLEVISIQAGVVLMIVVLQDGAVLQEMVTLGEPHTQEELSAQADRLNQTLRGMTAPQIEGKFPELPATDVAIAVLAVHLLRRAEEQHRQVFHAGLADMFRQPEFIAPRHGESQMSANERVRHMVEFLSQGQAVERLIAGLPPAARVHIVIGGDLTVEGLHDYSFVLGRYGDEDESSGFLGVVGPTRLEYPRAVTLVRYMSGLMTDLMQAH